MEHVFAICAYGDSPYLPECIASLEAQRAASPVLLCTATPSERLERLAREHQLSYCVNTDAPNIAGDWNFALAQAKAIGAGYVTLCHQDDLYLPDYGEGFRQAAARDPEMLIYFSDYGEQRGEKAVTASRLLRIKRLLLMPLRLRATQKWTWCKRLALSLGDPICCPAVTFNLDRLPLPLFERGMSTNLDWQTWERISRLPGRFAYDPAVRMLHRIHPGSTTSQVLGEGGRRAQDEAMFRKFWPAPLARLLTRLYAASEKSNNL
ncbi:MAG: glycosyltransferase family A protein [Aristaeellaceae bacterium]